MPALGNSIGLPFIHTFGGASGAPAPFVKTQRMAAGVFVNNNAGALKTSKAYRISTAFPLAIFINETSG